MINLQPIHLFTQNLGAVEWDALISEQHESTEAFTEYPVESGTPINDHHYKQNDVLTLTVAHGAAPFKSAFQATTDISVRMGFLWEQLRTAQRNGELFEVGTALELYTNMAIVSLSSTRDRQSTTISNIVIGLREVIVIDINETDRFNDRFAEAGGVRNRASTTSNQGNQTTEDISGTAEEADVNQSLLFNLLTPG